MSMLTINCTLYLDSTLCKPEVSAAKPAMCKRRVGEDFGGDAWSLSVGGLGTPPCFWLTRSCARSVEYMTLVHSRFLSQSYLLLPVRRVQRVVYYSKAGLGAPALLWLS